MVNIPDPREGEKGEILTCGYGKNSGFGLAFSRDVLSDRYCSLRGRDSGPGKHGLRSSPPGVEVGRGEGRGRTGGGEPEARAAG